MASGRLPVQFVTLLCLFCAKLRAILQKPCGSYIALVSVPREYALAAASAPDADEQPTARAVTRQLDCAEVRPRLRFSTDHADVVSHETRRRIDERARQPARRRLENERDEFLLDDASLWQGATSHA